jgi:hypothetical protein
MPKFKPNTSSAMKKKSTYKMKYQGNASAFPFKSPIKNEDDLPKTHSDTTTAGNPIDPAMIDWLSRQGFSEKDIDKLHKGHEEKLKKKKEE